MARLVRAVNACKGLLMSVGGAHVSRHGALVSGTVVALRARVGLFSGVRADVLGEHTLLARSVIAPRVVTGKRLLARVNPEARACARE